MCNDVHPSIHLFSTGSNSETVCYGEFALLFSDSFWWTLSHSPAQFPTANMAGGPCDPPSIESFLSDKVHPSIALYFAKTWEYVG